MASSELIIAMTTLSENPSPTDAQMRKIEANCLVSIADSLESLVSFQYQKLL